MWTIPSASCVLKDHSQFNDLKSQFNILVNDLLFTSLVTKRKLLVLLQIYTILYKMFNILTISTLIYIVVEGKSQASDYFLFLQLNEFAVYH